MSFCGELDWCASQTFECGKSNEKRNTIGQSLWSGNIFFFAVLCFFRQALLENRVFYHSVKYPVQLSFTVKTV
jgi:hypothetical protein